MRVLESHEYLAALGLTVDEVGLPTRASLAEFSRLALWRWGLCPRSTLTRFLLERAQAGQLDETQFRKRLGQVLDGLLELGDVAAVHTTAGPRLARTQPCWVRLSDDVGAVSGTLPSRLLGEGFGGAAPDDLARRFDPRSVTAAVTLKEHGVAQLSPAQWLGTPGFAGSLAHRGRAPDEPVSAVWEALVGKVTDEGVPLSALEGVSALAATPGRFFGRPEGTPDQRGRWRSPDEEGVWLARRPGHGQRELPVVIQVASDGRVLSLDLFDNEDYCWALIARGCAVGAREVITTVEDAQGVLLHVTVPLPRQARQVLRLIGYLPDERGWSWRVDRGTLPTAQALFDTLGLDLRSEDAS